MSWVQVIATTWAEQAELLADELSQLGALAVTLVDGAEQPIYEPLPGTTPLWQCTQVVGLFPATTDGTSIYAQLQAWHPHIQQWQVQALADRPWEQTEVQPLCFGHRLWIMPPNSVRPPHAIVVEMNPGQAFGTGTHPTTALCLQWLDQADLQQKQVIDYGCGSGILAIAASKLGASKVFAVDHDPQAWTATQRNADHNGVANGIECVQPAALPPAAADIILANILANPLIELAPHLLRCLKPTGTLVLAGLLTSQIEAVTAAYRPYLQMKPPVIQEDWVRLEGSGYEQ